MSRLLAWFFLFFAVVMPLCAESHLITYRYPAELPTSKAYQVEVAGEVVPAMQTQRGAVLQFGMRGPLELKVGLGRKPSEVVVRPLSAGVKAVLDEGGFRIHLAKPMNLSVEVDGNTDDPLLVFANPELVAPDRNDPKVKFFEGGKVHDAGEIFLKDGETLYLEGGAVVRGVVRAVGATHVAVRGPGILDGGTRNHKINMLVLRECRHAVLEDFLLLDPLGWSIHLSGSQQVAMTNVRVIGWRANSDGLDIEYSKDVTVKGCFWRTNDDCIAVKAIYPPGVQGVPFEEMINPEFLGGHKVEPIKGDSMGNIDISECVLWNDSGGQGFEVGFELRIDEIKGITFRDSDIIHVMGGGAFTIHNGDQAKIRDVLIEDVRVEDTERFVDFQVGLSIYSVDCPREFHRSNPQRKGPTRRPKYANNPWQWFIPDEDKLAYHESFRGFVDGVVFRNVELLSEPKKGSIMMGFSKNRGITDVRFENVIVAGKPVRSAEDGQILKNEYVTGLEFTNPVTSE